MAAKIDLRILRFEDGEAILAFERERLDQTLDDPMERELASWSAPWRQEALNHYLATGWSLGAFAGDRLVGYLLAQPLLFFNGLTQTLWVERLAAVEAAVGHALAEASWRWAKDKHLQKMIFGQPDLPFDLSERLEVKAEEARWMALATARMKT